jgi:hypothetical protein
MNATRYELRLAIVSFLLGVAIGLLCIGVNAVIF